MALWHCLGCGKCNTTPCHSEILPLHVLCDWSKFDTTMYELYAIEPLWPSADTGATLWKDSSGDQVWMLLMILDLANIPYTCPDASVLIRPRTFGCLGKLSDCREKERKEETRGRREMNNGGGGPSFFFISVLSWLWCKWCSLSCKFSEIFFLSISVCCSKIPFSFFLKYFLSLVFSTLVNSYL